MRGQAAALSCLLFACIVHRTNFVYIELVDPRSESTQLGGPSVDAYDGDPLPLSYLYRHGQGDIHVALGRESFVPSLRIEAPVPIEVEAGRCATVLRQSPTEVAVIWNYWRPPSQSCISVGDAVEVTIAFNGTTESLTLIGTVQQGGTFRYTDSL